MEEESLTVLLAEDNRDHAELVKRNLQVCRGVNSIVHVEDGEEALNYLYNRGCYSDLYRYPKPELILLDLRLPKIDGIEILRIVKKDKALYGVPIVVLTSSTAEQDLKRAYDNHANSYLVKPVIFEDFVIMLKELGDYWLMWNKQPCKDWEGT